MWLNNKKYFGSHVLCDLQKGFSLIEAMVATVIMGIAFTGIYSLASYSNNFVYNSSERQDLQVIANQIFEVIESDKTNISNYAADLKVCNAPSQSQTQKYYQYNYKWCRMLNDMFGTAASSDIRQITVTNISGGILLTVTLQAKNNRSEIVMKRFYD
jgi:prepilin-type N-terminal cleavage/methylation domain-containing protein